MKEFKGTKEEIGVMPRTNFYKSAGENVKENAKLKEAGFDVKFECLSVGGETAQFAIVPLDLGRKGDHKEEAYANAKLIAAAPDLLEALQDIIRQIDYPQTSSFDRDGTMIRKPSTEKIKKAIDKAL